MNNYRRVICPWSQPNLLLHVSSYYIPPLEFLSCAHYLLQTGKWKTDERSKQREISHIAKALNDTRHPLVRNNTLRSVLLHNIIDVLWVRLERM